MADDFRQMMRTSMARGVADATLRVWAPQGAEVHVRPPGRARRSRTSPIVPSQAGPADPRVPDRLVGRRVPRLPRRRCGCRRSRSAPSSSSSRVQLVVGGEVVGQGLVKATWSDDTTLTTRINPAVAHYTGQTELASAIQEGLAAKAAGDEDTATAEARARRAARGRDRRRRGHQPAQAGRRHRGRRDRHRAAQGQGVEARRDGARHQLDQDHAGALMTYTLPAGSPVAHRRLLRRVRRTRSTPPRRRRSSRPAAALSRPAPPSSLNLDPTRDRSRGDVPELRDREPGRRAVLRGVRLRLHHRPAADRRRRRPAAPPPAPGADWVAELWIDPEWFAHQDAPGGCATSGAPTVVPLRGDDDHRSDAGRRAATWHPSSTARATAPSPTSTRQLTLDRDRWYVEDLGSTNGTFVGAPGEPLPDHAARRPGNAASSPTTSASTSAPGPASWSGAPPTTRSPARPPETPA